MNSNAFAGCKTSGCTDSSSASAMRWQIYGVTAKLLTSSSHGSYFMSMSFFRQDYASSCWQIHFKGGGRADNTVFLTPEPQGALLKDKGAQGGALKEGGI